MSSSTQAHASSRRQARKSWFSCIIASTLTFAFAIGHLFLMPRLFLPAFDEFDADLPLLTAWLIGLPSAGVAVFTGIVIAALIAKEILISHKRLTRGINLLVAVLIFLGVALYTFSFVSPLLQLMQSAM